VKLLSPTRRTLEYQLELVEYLRQEILSITREIRELSRSEKYSKRVNSLLSILGVGLITAMSLIVELGDINRFRGEKAFAGYLGLIPTCKNSGEKIRTGEMTPRGNKRLRTMLIESSWIAILYDKALAAKYAELRVKMGSQKAIIRIARKLSNRIFSVLKSEKIYEYDRYI
jgi:transposase